jgi:small subunit ribosomal protein S20
MANHVSAEKRARQTPKRQARNASVRSRVHSAERAVLAAISDPKKAELALREAFSALQKSRGVLHRNTVTRKMAKLSKAVARASK